MYLLLFSSFLLGAVSSQILDLREGEECRPLGGGQGICRALRQCNNAGDFKRNHPPICTFKGKEPVICCPNALATRAKAGTRADKYCQTIYKDKRSCGAIRLFARELKRIDDSQLKDSGGTILSTTENPQAGRQFVHGGIEAMPHRHKYMDATVVRKKSTGACHEYDIQSASRTELEAVQDQNSSFRLRRSELRKQLSSWSGTDSETCSVPPYRCGRDVYETEDDTFHDCAGLNSGNDCRVGPALIRKRDLNVPEVVGGTFTRPRTTPFMVLIGYGDQKQISWGCGGSLITARYVLSAAHCVNPSTSLGMAKWARLGDLDLSSNTEDAKPINMRIVERIPYPDYIDTQSYHDIAIFKLERDVAFNAWILPICLHTKRDIGTLMSTVIGWGRTDFAEGTSDKLLEADLQVYNETECNRLMFSSPSTKTPRGYLADQMFCAGVPDGSKDACLGDSGGPLVTRKIADCIKTQIGITSFGNNCGLPNSPGVYTRVSNYVAWIEDVVFGDEMIV